MKKIFTLLMSITMFILTTIVLIGLPQAVDTPYDYVQWVIYGLMVVGGYLVSYLYFDTFMDEVKKARNSNKPTYF